MGKRRAVATIRDTGAAPKGAGCNQGRQRRWTDLFIRAREGRPELFGVLSEEVGPHLDLALTWGRHARLRREDREDVVQETFLRAWKHRESFDARRSPVAAWLWRIAHNVAIDLLRRPAPLGGSLAFLADLAPAADQDPGLDLDAGELQEHLERALLALKNPNARRAVELRLQGVPYADISGRLGVPQGTVAGWVHRLREELKRLRTPA